LAKRHRIVVCAASIVAVEGIQIGLVKRTFLGSLRSSLQYNSEFASSNFSISYVGVYFGQILMLLRFISNGCEISFVPQEIHIMKILLLCSKICEFLRLPWIFIPI